MLKGENVEELHLRIRNKNQKIDFEWDLTLMNRKTEIIYPEEQNIQEKIKEQLYNYYLQKQKTINSNKFKELRKLVCK